MSKSMPTSSTLCGPTTSEPLNIDNFVQPAAIDPLYFDGRTYFLVPAGREAAEPYQVLCQAMQHQDRCGIGHVVMSGKEQLVLVRTAGEMLIMAMLVFPAEIRSAEQIELPQRAKVDARKTKLAENLIRSWSHERFDFDSYENDYRQQLAKLIAAKVAGREVVTPAAEAEAPPVINLMDALKRSLARGSSGKHKARPSKLRPASKTARHKTKAVKMKSSRQSVLGPPRACSRFDLRPPY